MGIKLSSIGGLTSSQKAGKTPEEQTKLLGKLSDMSINKPILEKVEKEKKTKKEAVATTGYGRAVEKTKTYKSSKRNQ